MPTFRVIRRFARDAGLACVAAAAVAAGYRLARPAAGPTVADATDALDAAANGGSVGELGGKPGGGAAELRVYDVRDLLRGPLAYEASQGRADGPAGYRPAPAKYGAYGRYSIRGEEGLRLSNLLKELAVARSVKSVERRKWCSSAGGRLFITLPVADHARVGAMLDALRLAERARPGWRVER